MFGLFGPDKVEFVEMSDTILTYRSRKKKQKLGVLQKIGLQFIADGAPQTVNIDVVPDSFRLLPDSSTLVISHAVGKPQELNFLFDLLASAPRPDLGRLARRSERLPLSLRILSQQLPGYRAVSIDISLHGVQIQCEGLLQVNTYMNLTLELEQPDLPQLTLQALVVWARTEEERRKAYRAGLEFTKQHPDTQAIWNQVYANLLKMQSQSVLQKTLGSQTLTSPREQA